MKVKVLLVASLITGLMAGCGPKESPKDDGSTSVKNQETKELLVWEDVSKSDGIKEAIKKFEQEKNVKIKVVEKEYAKQIEDLRLDGPAGTGPDVITIPGDQIGGAVVTGLLKELSVDNQLKGLYTDAAMESQIVNGKVYGLPKAVETQILYYNKDLIKEADLPKTTDDWFNYSKSVTKDGKYGLLALWDQIYYAQGVMSGFGGYVFGKNSDGSYNPEDIGLNSKGAIEGLNYIQKFYKDGLFPKGIVGENGIKTLDSLFTEGKATAVISGPWNIQPYKDAGINYGVLPLPLLPNGEHMGSFVGVKSYNVSSYSKNAELAEELVKFLTNEENSKVRYEVTKEVPAVKSLASDPSVTQSESATAVATQSQYAELIPGIVEMNSVWTPMDSSLQTVVTGKEKVENALNTAVKTIKDTIAATKK